MFKIVSRVKSKRGQEMMGIVSKAVITRLSNTARQNTGDGKPRADHGSWKEVVFTLEYDRRKVGDRDMSLRS
jgi:hypothetical protein